MACCSRSRLRSYSHSSSTRQPLPPAPFRQRIDRPLPLLYVTSVYPRVYVRVCVRECVYRKVVAAPIDTYCYWYSSCGSALLHATLDRRSRPEIRSVKLRIDWFSLFVGFFFPLLILGYGLRGSESEFTVSIVWPHTRRPGGGEEHGKLATCIHAVTFWLASKWCVTSHLTSGTVLNCF